MKKNIKFKTIICFMIGLILAALFKIFILEAVRIDGISMEDSLHDGQTVIVDKIAYGINNPFSCDLLVQWDTPKVNDIVLFYHNNKLVIKRCAGIQGDNLEYFTDLGYILLLRGVQQIPLTEEQFNNMKNCTAVPEGYILAIGDNYGQSFDSRNYGFVPVNNILGKVICRPTDFFQKQD